MRGTLPIPAGPVTRRQMLASSLAAFLLPEGAGAEARRPPAKGVIVVFLEGGMSHLDSWDPKPDAPAQVRGEFGTIATTVPSLRVSEYLPCLARQAHLYNVIRSVNCDARNDHSPGMHILMTGWENVAAGISMERFNYHHPSQGSVIAQQLGVTSAQGVPRFVAVPRKGQLGGAVNYATPAFLGPAFEPFESGEPPAAPTQPMTATPSLLVSRDSVGRLDDRSTLRARFDRLHAYLDRNPDALRLDEHYQRAFRLLGGQELLHALDLSREPFRVRERYGRSVLGQSLLLARRLAEAGVTYVLVNPHAANAWDTHARNFEGHRRLMPPMDQAVAALVADLAERGTLDDILVLVAGEMGRTPLINNAAGRDHWTFAYSVLLAGGGLTRGQVLGSTSRLAEWPSSRPVKVTEILATIYHQLGLDAGTLLRDEQGRPIPILPEAQPIAELIGSR